MQRYLFKWKE